MSLAYTVLRFSQQWWAHSDSNRGRTCYEQAALTAVLYARFLFRVPRQVSLDSKSELLASFDDGIGKCDILGGVDPLVWLWLRRITVELRANTVKRVKRFDTLGSSDVQHRCV